MSQLTPMVMAFCLTVGTLLFVVLLYASLVFVKEKEVRATNRSLLLLFLLPTPFLAAHQLDLVFLAFALMGACLLLLILFLIPFPTRKDLCEDYPLGQLDERDIMFSRNELQPDTHHYNEYYQNHPEKKILDDAFRKEAGLGSKDSLFYHPLAFASAEASFFAVEQLKNAVDGPINPIQQQIDPLKISHYLKQWTCKLGALDSGITELQPYHFYSHKGRGENYGTQIESDHSFALAFTVEMCEEMVQAAPQSPIIMESAQQYLDAGRIAIQVAAFIRQLGYSARAHIDGNYQVVCPLVARDAGLGEIGRMGLLMTPKQGPRVRIAVVTTNLKLKADRWKKSHSTLDFCYHCKKCAEVCPSKSISFDAPQMVEGIRRWQINSENCFTYWCKAGTDCGRCMATCPYSHPDNALHNSIRWGIRKSSFFRRLAVHLDDFFYGRKPKAGRVPEWIGGK
ncbi:MAG: 4Fe-4S dicluster domain-containing protein [Marinifilaceae bacterium]